MNDSPQSWNDDDGVGVQSCLSDDHRVARRRIDDVSAVIVDFDADDDSDDVAHLLCLQNAPNADLRDCVQTMNAAVIWAKEHCVCCAVSQVFANYCHHHQHHCQHCCSRRCWSCSFVAVAEVVADRV